MRMFQPHGCHASYLIEMLVQGPKFEYRILHVRAKKGPSFAELG